jgi:murein hydrolase activator
MLKSTSLKHGVLKYLPITPVNGRGLLLFVFFCLPVLIFAQSKKELEDKRKKIIRDIETTQRMIKKTAASKEATYDKFLALQSQIESRETLIQTIQDEIAASDEAVARNQSVIAALNEDIARMEEEYGRTIRSAFRRKTLSNPLLYLLSAESLNQAFRRWLFLRKYDQFRRSQALAIRATREMLAQKIASIEAARIEKQELLGAMQGQKATLTVELTDKNELLTNLGKDEERLKSDLQKKQTAHEALNKAIEHVIEDEVRRRVEEARKTKAAAPPPAPVKTEPAPSKPAPITNTKPKSSDSKPANNTASTELPTTPEGSEDSETFDFRRNKGKLPWPVESGFIARGFGRQKHPTIKTIEITNNGIDIRTEEGAAVRAIAGGRVAGVEFIPGHDYTVIIQHGDYYTVYSNLAATNLSKGQMVKGRQSIGQVSTNAITGTSELHFELWQGKDRMNPAAWIKK